MKEFRSTTIYIWLFCPNTQPWSPDLPTDDDLKDSVITMIFGLGAAIAAFPPVMQACTLDQWIPTFHPQMFQNLSHFLWQITFCGIIPNVGHTSPKTEELGGEIPRCWMPGTQGCRGDGWLDLLPGLSTPVPGALTVKAVLLQVSNGGVVASRDRRPYLYFLTYVKHC